MAGPKIYLKSLQEVRKGSINEEQENKREDGHVKEIDTEEETVTAVKMKILKKRRKKEEEKKEDETEIRF